jgi:hypothetical protein
MDAKILQRDELSEQQRIQREGMEANESAELENNEDMEDDAEEMDVD